MKDAAEKIAQIDKASQKGWFISLLLILAVGMIGIAEIMRMNPTTLLSAGKIVLATLVMLSTLTHLDNRLRVRRWKALFLEDFPEIDPIAMKKTAGVFKCSFPVVASAVVFAEDEWDFERHTFRDEQFRSHSERVRAKQQYLAFVKENITGG